VKELSTFHYIVNDRPPLDSVLSQLNLLQAFNTLFKIHFKKNLPSTPWPLQ